MASAKTFVSSIYLGDRGCKKITMDACQRELSVQVDCISRIRSGDGNWNYYNDENIENGELVFMNIKKLLFDNNGFIPNDYINGLSVDESDDGYWFTLSIDSVKEDGSGREVIIKILAESMALRDPSNPDILIVD